MATGTIIRAPVDCIVELRLVELGDFVDRGDTIARLVDLDPMLIVTQVNERDVQSLTVGAPGKARLIGGLTVEGRLRPISSVADEAARTFRVGLEVIGRAAGRDRGGEYGTISVGGGS